MKHPIPNTALDDRLGFVGTAGSGKTYGAGTLVERLLSSSARVVIPDPLGVWWGLALDKDGKTPSAFRKRDELVIFGGPRGDLGLTEHSGTLIGETVAGMAESCILDLSEFKTGAAERRFMLAFLTALYRHKTKQPLHVIFDEADLWAPQRVTDKEGGSMKLLGMMENICRRGRVKGFIPWLISQRPAVISKNVLSQIDGMIAFKLTSVQDRDAIGDWVQGQADKAQWKEMWGQMPTLERGQGLVWLPARNLLTTSPFPEKITFDSSRAPKRGERVTTAKGLTPVNLDKLKERLATVDAEIKADDPKRLRAQVHEKDREIAALKQQLTYKSTPAADPAAIKKAEEQGYGKGYARGKIDGYGDALASVQAEYAETAKAIGRVEAELKQLRASAGAIEAWARRAVKHPPKVAAIPAQAAAPRAAGHAPAKVKPTTPITPGNGDFTRPQTKVLESLAMWRSLGHETPSRPMVAAIAGYSPSSGGFNNLLGSLKSLGAIDYPQPGSVTLLDGGGTGVPSKEEGRNILLGNLSAPQKKIVAALIDQGTLTRENVGESTGYSATSGGYNNLLGSLRTLGLIDYPQPGLLTLTEWAQELLAGYSQRIAA